MKKQLVLLCLTGALAGVFITVIISIVISFLIGDGGYYPVSPQLEATLGSTFRAVVVQTVTAAFYGAVWGGASLIWKRERWSLLRQTVTHLCLMLIVTLPVAWGLGWMGRSLAEASVYAGIFLAIYAIIWGSSFLAMHRHIKEINRKLGS